MAAIVELPVRRFSVQSMLNQERLYFALPARIVEHGVRLVDSYGWIRLAAHIEYCFPDD